MTKAIVTNVSRHDGAHVLEARYGDWRITVHLRPDTGPVTASELAEPLGAVAAALAAAPAAAPAADPPWSDAEDAALVRAFDASYDLDAVAARLGRPARSVRQRLTLFGRLPAMDPVTGRTIEPADDRTDL
ncbi:hypothetical protein OG884_27560 [Streptosporangium sp. NBC_01755]|uniref:hypothetical protein n=1 Tax=unclassified Streptosporangium TaxID=2632669 RepID=UPI002DD89FCD|nr:MULTISPECIES: hypothetical protein [unclassified Streptosporangium]WSA23263.1 hypothetical protein OIE13_20045 [Streptosporangium sp. NBC_01810]WSC98599.1 hypothetical protein OG884_27560 [Streptosporangium sp. NBC_01755]